MMGSTRRPHRAAKIVAALAVALVAAACGNGATEPGADPPPPADTDTSTDDAAPGEGGYDLDALVAAATAEGQVTIYSSQALDALNETAEAFMAKYPGISVEVVRGIDGELGGRLDAELETGRGAADLIVGASRSLFEGWSDAGDLLPVEGPQLLGEDEYDVDMYVHDGNYFEQTAAVLLFAWNTDLYPDGLSDYPDLLDPALADGKIGVVEPSVQSIVDWYVWIEDIYGEDLVEELAAQNPRIYPSALPMQEALVSGEIFAGSFIAPAVAEPAIAQGAPIAYDLGPAGAWGARYFAGVPRTAPNPNAGFLLANFMVTREGQELIAQNAGATLPNISSALITNDQVRWQDLDLLTEEFVAEYQAKWQRLFR